MKFKILYMALFVSNVASSQSWNQGGNNVGASNQSQRIGTNNNRPLRIETANTERIHINNGTGATAGFVGINNTNPQFQLDVTGSGIATGFGWSKGIMLRN